MKQEIKIFENAFLLSEAFSEEFYKKSEVYSKNKQNFNVALSGGSTPITIFETLSLNYRKKINWENIHLYWGDERCVPAEDKESNFGMAKKFLLDNIKIQKSNLHRIKGEEEPYEEAIRYSDVIMRNIPFRNNLPSFDLVMLGLGMDGHTASIFPDQMQVINSDRICEVTVNPSTKQKRITLTGKIINNSKNISFIVSGNNKADIVYKILKKTNGYHKLPASRIKPVSGEIEWLLDACSAALLKK